RQRTRLQRLSRLPARVHQRLRTDGQPRDQGGGREAAADSDPRAADRTVQGADHPAWSRTRRRLRNHAQLLRPRQRRARLRLLRLLPAPTEGIPRGRRTRPDDLSGAPRSRRMTYTVKEIFYTLQG